MITYHILKDGKSFTIAARIGNGAAEHNVEIAFGATTDPAVIDAACRLVAHANVSVALQAAVEKIGNINDTKDPQKYLL